MKCHDCGEPASGIFVHDVRRLADGGIPICLDCVKKHERPGHIVRTVDPETVMNMVNPDISCDFCNQPDPQFMYDMDELIIQFHGETVNFGTEWAACEPCARDTEDGNYINTTMRLGTIIVLPVHKMVMERLRNKRPYVRPV